MWNLASSFVTLSLLASQATAGSCHDLPGALSAKVWFDGTNGCAEYAENNGWCTLYGGTDHNGEGSAREKCCACGGGTTACHTVELSGYSGVNSDKLGVFTYVGEDAEGEPYWQHSSVAEITLYKASDGSWMISDDIFDIDGWWYSATAVSNDPTESTGWNVWDGSTWVEQPDVTATCRGRGSGLEVSVTGYESTDCSGSGFTEDKTSDLQAALAGIEFTTCEELQPILLANADVLNFPPSASNYGTCAKKTETDEDGEEMNVSLRVHCKDLTGYDSEVDGPTPANKLPEDFEIDLVFCDARDCSGSCEPSEFMNVMGRTQLLQLGAKTCSDILKLEKLGDLDESFTSKDDWTWGECLDDGKNPLEGFKPVGVIVHCKDSTGFDSSSEGTGSGLEVSVTGYQSTDCSGSGFTEDKTSDLEAALAGIEFTTCEELQPIFLANSDLLNFPASASNYGTCAEMTEMNVSLIVHCKDSTGFDSSAESDNPSSEETKKGGSNTGLIIGVVCSVLVLLALGGFLYWKCAMKNDGVSTPDDGVSTPHETGQDSTNAHTSTDRGTEC